jgi:hypothetical protein
MGNLDQHTGAVTGLRVAAAGTTVSQIDQDLDALLNNLMALFATNTGDKTDAAGVMLVRWVKQTLRRW